MNKLEMAHDYAKIMLESGLKGEWDLTNLKDIAVDAFLLADAMQAEADKRKPNPVLPALHQTFIDGIEQPRYAKEWQPDWSQAPNGYNYWVATADHDGKITGGWFHDVEPEFGEGKGVSIYYSPNGNCVLTESFGYKGDWRDSLRKRPQ